MPVNRGFIGETDPSPEAYNVFKSTKTFPFLAESVVLLMELLVVDFLDIDALAENIVDHKIKSKNEAFQTIASLKNLKRKQSGRRPN